MSDNTTAIKNNDSAPIKSDISPEAQKIIDKSQLIQAEIQEGQLNNLKTVYDLIKRIDEKKKNEIEKQFEEGYIQLEQIDENDNVTQWTKSYRPMTTRDEEAVNKMLREIKLFRRDVKNKLPIEELQNKYPGLMDGVDSLEEIEFEKIKVAQKDKDGNPIIGSDNKLVEVEEEKESEAFMNIIDTYSIRKRAKIFFKIDDISNFSKKDLRLLIYLYQYRNNYNPYFVSPS